MLSWRKRKTNAAGLVSIYANRANVALVYRTRVSPTPEFRFCESFSCSIEEQEEKLTSAVSKHLLQGVECHYLLNPHEYRLLLLNAPNVPEDEMPSAARWLVKNLIDFPIDEASIATFPVPVRAGQPAKIYVIVCRKSRLIEIAEMIKVVGLKLTQISIPELAMRNILTWCPDVAKGVALLSFGKKLANLMLVRDDLIYLSRPIDTNPVESAVTEKEEAIDAEEDEERSSKEAEAADESEAAPEENGIEISRRGQVVMPNSESNIETKSTESKDKKTSSTVSHLSIPNLVLEIQRSLNYYQSHMGQQPPATLYVASNLDMEDGFFKELPEQFSFSVKMLDLNELISFASPLENEKQTQCMLAIGGAIPAKKNERETS